jgi:hypothetical protein
MGRPGKAGPPQGSRQRRGGGKWHENQKSWFADLSFFLVRLCECRCCNEAKATSGVSRPSLLRMGCYSTTCLLQAHCCYCCCYALVTGDGGEQITARLQTIREAVRLVPRPWDAGSAAAPDGGKQLERQFDQTYRIHGL